MSLFGHKQKTVEPDVIPTTVEQSIPIRDVCEDGIFLVGRNLWSKTYRFTDVNYATASKEDKEGMFFAYSEILNTFDAGAMTKITVNNRRLNQTKFRENNMLELQGDSLDKYRNEYNRILAGNANLSNGITQDKYLTVTVEKKTEEEARAYFNRISAEFAALFAKLGSRFEEVTAEEKLRILFDFFHYGAEDDYRYDAGLYAQRGYSFKDAIAPDCLEFRTDYFKMDGRYGRVLYLRDYANFIKDSFIAELTDIDRGIDMLEKQFDSVIIPPTLHHVHPKAAIKKRNEWMVEQAQLLLCCVEKQSGGAYTAMKYAERLGKEIINLATPITETF